MPKSKHRNTSIYIKDKDVYERLLLELSLLWFQKFGESLPVAELLIKAMAIAKQYVQDDLQSTKGLQHRGYARMGQ